MGEGRRVPRRAQLLPLTVVGSFRSWVEGVDASSSVRMFRFLRTALAVLALSTEEIFGALVGGSRAPHPERLES